MLVKSLVDNFHYICFRPHDHTLYAILVKILLIVDTTNFDLDVVTMLLNTMEAFSIWMQLVSVLFLHNVF